MSRLSNTSNPLLAVVVIAVGVFSSIGSFAHGGEDHGAAPPPPSSSDPGQRQASTSSSSLEAVLRWPAAAAGEVVTFRVLLSHFDSNAPVEGATVTLDLTAPGAGGALPSLTLKETPSPGVYEAFVKANVDGVHAAALTVVAGELVDTVTFGALVFGPAEEEAHDEHEHEAADGVAPVVVVAIVVGAVVIIAALALALRRRRATVAALMLCFAPSAFAHGSDDHEHADAATANKGPLSTNTVVLPKESQFLLGIRTVPAVMATVGDQLEVPGVVTAPPERHAAIFAAQQGRIVVDAKGLPMLGSTVKKGQLLAVLEAALTVSERASFSVESSQAAAEVAASLARVQAAEKNLARLQSLQGVVAERERDNAAVALSQAQAALSSAQGKENAYGSNERSMRIELRAPIGGVVADVDVSPGELVEPGRRAFLIVDGAELWVEARVYEADLAKVSAGASAAISVDAWVGEIFPGTLLAVGEVVDPQTRTVKALFRVDNSKRRLKLGMFAHVAIGGGEQTAALVVPESAVLDVDGARIVFVHIAPELFQLRRVATGRRDGNRVEVRGDVAVGDRIAVTGLLTLKNAPAAPAPPTATPTKTPAPTSAPTSASPQHKD